jgi:hypothetical protein
MGGQVVSLRYYLGRLIHRNLFRVSDEAVSSELQRYLSKATSKQGAAVIRSAGVRGWAAAELLLRDTFERRFLGESSCNAKHVAAIRSLLSNPALSLDEIASEARTTVKQLNRLPILTDLLRHNPYRPPTATGQA